MASSQSHPSKRGRAAMRDSIELTMRQQVVEQYLARIGYVSGPEQHLLEPHSGPRSFNGLANIEGVQAKILKQLKEQSATPQKTPTRPITRPITQTHRAKLCRESSPPVIHDKSFPTRTSETEALYQPPEPTHESVSPSPPSPPITLTKVERLAGLYTELKRRQSICQGIERQVEACQKQIRLHPSKQQKIEREHEKRIEKFLKPIQNERQNPIDAGKRKGAQTAKEAEIEEMRNIYLQYDRQSLGVPVPESVDAFFTIIATTEHHIKKAEEAHKAAKKREGNLEEKLYRARCAMFEMEELIEEVENGGMEKEKEPPGIKVEERGIEDRKERKRMRKRGKGGKDRQQAKGDGGDEKVGRRRQGRRKVFGKPGKMNSDTVLDC